ncbi:toll/interleukin-1 receptor domain-containing protein [Paraburkholderia terrae]|uniref:toll/interleukin-1 receptor domain-containing protein n=1 Tax=Paraburkholderia terrae TaxID=311230 RepID=UPI00296AAFBD|nr:toll/interleukin-1 receptor domain-containing protein [Paraburkholderia terrae]MDW3657389.1 toll/interleukin-1 receptor domain-containing protein [Paraburkholderia terrae]
MNNRDFIFISHAAPENNEFATWLAARLTAAGYNVWVELRELEAGDRFWPDIESAIRTRAVKFVTVVAKPASLKFGYRRELSMADAIDRSAPGFIIPVRIDEIGPSEVPAEINDKHILDFTDGWHRGLAALVKRLEKDDVIRHANTDITASNLAVLRLDEQQKTISSNESLSSNWLCAESVPAGIRLHQFEGEPVSDRAFKGEWPARVVGKTVITFAKATDFALRKHYSGSVTSAEILLEAFLAAKCPQLPTLSARDRLSILVDIIRQGWERSMTLRGLHAYEMSNKRLSWYLPWNMSAGKQLSFTDAAGKAGRRALNGESVKLSSRWHFAVTPNVLIKPELRVGFNYTVVFTTDGLEPLEDKVKAHRFRRSFCKSWWQDRWRDMLSAYLAFIKGREPTFSIPLSPDRGISFQPHLATYIAPVSALDPVRTDLLPDDVVDSLSGDEPDVDYPPELDEQGFDNADDMEDPSL